MSAKDEVIKIRGDASKIASVAKQIRRLGPILPHDESEYDRKVRLQREDDEAEDRHLEHLRENHSREALR